MDDELTMLATALAAPEPTEETADRSRHRLQNTMRGGPARRRRVGRLAGGLGLGLTAVTAATAIVLTSTGTPRTPNPNSPPTTAAPSTLSARQILLAAATTAEKAPATSGTYWHVKTVYTKTSKGDSDTGATVIETWTRRDGRSWVRTGSPTSPVKENGGPHKGIWNNGFFVGDTRLSFEQIQRLPDDPTALKTFIKQHSRLMRLVGKGKGKVSEDEVVIGGLVGLLERTPAPPAVRAAGFRALADLPEVKKLGPVKGGQGLQISYTDGWARLVVDPATSRLRNSDFGDHKASGTSRVDAAEWTNTPPK
ncbi:CU044_5270 family protein [Actinoallomurus sp. NPDC052274]|uniref:CU044_5270 family protein n=1 Tax=Actinoallomurus sp. NPDC052274 TaxID=3155420 RepID=UPI00341934C6